MSEIRIGLRYAKSLFDKANESNNLDKVATDVNVFLNTLADSRDLEVMLNSPVIKRDVKVSVLNSIFKSFQPDTLGFFELTVNKHREMFLQAAAQQFIVLYNSSKGIAIANVVSAVKLDDSTANKITDFVKTQTGKQKIELRQSIDKSVIGGLVISFEDKLYDTSINTQINKLKKELNIA